MSLERLVPGTEGWDRYHGDHLQRYNYFVSRYRGKSVLDMACGVGYGSEIIASKGAASVLGIDIATEAISFAHEHYKVPNLEFRQMDFRDVPGSGKLFDLVMSFETIEHIEDPAEFLRVAAAVLKPGGKCIVSTPNKKKYSGTGTINPFHVSELYYEDFKKLFLTNFSIDQEYQQSESVSYQRWLYLKEHIDTLNYNYERLPFARAKSLVKKLIGKKAKAAFDYPQKINLQELDFTIEPMPEYKDHFSVIILEGTKL